jgi:hypothetical protein
MATTIYSNESLYKWGSSGHIKLDASYDYWRNGADMHYSITAVVKQTSTGSWFNDSVGCQMWLDDVLIYDNSTLKGSTSSSTKAWSRTASVSDATVSNKTTGSTTLRIRVWDSQGAADFNANRYPSLAVSPAMPILSVSTPNAALNYATFTITDSTGQSMTNYEIANSSGTTVQSGTISGSSASIKFTTVAANTRMSHNTTYSGYKIRAKNAIGWGDYVTIPSFKTGNLPNASTSGNFSLGSSTKVTISSSNNISAWSVTASDGTSPKTGTGSGTECTIAVNDSSYVNSMLANHPNDTSWTMYYTVHLYSDGEYLGYVTTQNTCSIPSGNYNPTFASSNISYADTDTTITGITGNNQKIIKGFSDVKFTVSPMTPGTGATASKYKVSANSATQEANSTGSSLNFTFNNVATNSYSAQAIDSRGKSTTVTGNYSTFIEYVSPAFLSNSTKRTEQGIGTNVNINASFSYYNWTGLSQDNIITEVKYKVGTGSWVTLTNNTDYTYANGTLTINHTTTGGSFAQGNIYTITLSVKDRLVTREATITIPSSQPLLWKDRLNKWLGIKKKPTCALDVDGAMKSSSYVDATNGFRSYDTGHADTSNACSRIVIKRVSSSEAPNNGVILEFGNSTSWTGQLFIGDNADQGCYWNGWSNGQRGSWKKMIMETDLLNRMYPVGSVYFTRKSPAEFNPNNEFGGSWRRLGNGYDERFIYNLNNNHGSYENGSGGWGTSTAASDVPLQAHSHTGTTSTNGAHTHTYGAWKPKRAGDGSKWGTADNDGSYTTSSNGDHNHTFTTDTAGSGNGSHSHTVPYIGVFGWERYE